MRGHCTHISSSANIAAWGESSEPHVLARAFLHVACQTVESLSSRVEPGAWSKDQARANDPGGVVKTWCRLQEGVT
jgi:hypothetical protein